MTRELEPYKLMVDFLADYLGENTEVVLHDLGNLHQSIVAIRNGYISGRRIGAPVTDFAMEMIKAGAYKNKPYEVNYKGRSQKGDSIRSATYFIKDGHQRLVGLLCINTDCQRLIDARNILDAMINASGVNRVTELPDETFNIDVKDLVINNLRRVLPPDYGDLAKLSKQEKIDICEKLQDVGTFLVKGTVWHVADMLGVSVPTIYRYLATIKKENEL